MIRGLGVQREYKEGILKDQLGLDKREEKE